MADDKPKNPINQGSPKPAPITPASTPKPNPCPHVPDELRPLLSILNLLLE